MNSQSIIKPENSIESILPLLSNEKQKQPANVLSKQNFQVMLNLPVIVREKEIYDRKDTIGIFETKHIDNKQQAGKLFLNEFWSDKYHRQILRASKIKDQLDKIKQLVRRNVNVLIDDVHNVVTKQNIMDQQMVTLISMNENNFKDANSCQSIKLGRGKGNKSIKELNSDLNKILTQCQSHKKSQSQYVL